MKNPSGLVFGTLLMGALVFTGAGCASPASGDTSGKNMSPYDSIVDSLIRNSSTFKFDGIADSVKVVKAAQKADGTWEYTVEYQTRQAGHGDRSGMMLAQVITTHNAEIEVKGGKVTAAVCNGVWDVIADMEKGDGMQMTMPAGNVTGIDDMLVWQTMPAGENVTGPAPDLAAK